MTKNLFLKVCVVSFAMFSLIDNSHGKVQLEDNVCTSAVAFGQLDQDGIPGCDPSKRYESLQEHAKNFKCNGCMSDEELAGETNPMFSPEVDAAIVTNGFQQYNQGLAEKRMNAISFDQYLSLLQRQAEMLANQNLAVNLEVNAPRQLMNQEAYARERQQDLDAYNMFQSAAAGLDANNRLGSSTIMLLRLTADVWSSQGGVITRTHVNTNPNSTSLDWTITKTPVPEFNLINALTQPVQPKK